MEDYGAEERGRPPGQFASTAFELETKQPGLREKANYELKVMNLVLKLI